MNPTDSVAYGVAVYANVRRACRVHTESLLLFPSQQRYVERFGRRLAAGAATLQLRRAVIALE